VIVLYRGTFLIGFFWMGLFEAFGFLPFEMFLLPGRELGGRIDVPGRVIGVIENVMISSIFPITILYNNHME
jgi:hypothetical protein